VECIQGEAKIKGLCKGMRFLPSAGQILEAPFNATTKACETERVVGVHALPREILITPSLTVLFLPPHGEMTLSPAATEAVVYLRRRTDPSGTKRIILKSHASVIEAPQ
jgi:hypothetical protein